ncbi:protein STICHEL-like 3 isoform X2 [Cornus florida]|uniref:protein STICHEL-like 3 isoform X2 n=1 Tax=Cornus florida TaxID=4283 RepID=UPI0028A251FD|nr:protein STICHEL-like 3 isoform X2 [Cornus florida]
MTRAVRDRILKDANGSISDHLRNHIHLTNCIHLKNHMHKHSPILAADRSLVRDLVVLQRSRSLRDPSTSPPSWHSPSVVDLLSKLGENDVTVPTGRRSVGIERQRNGRRLSGSSPPLANQPITKVAAREVIRHNDRVAAVSEHSSKSGIQQRRRIKGEESSGKNLGNGPMGGNDKPLQDGNDLVDDIALGNTEQKAKKTKQKGKHREDVLLKTLSEQLNEVRTNSDDVASSYIHLHGKHTQNELTHEEAEASIHGYCSGLSRIKRRKFRGARRTRAAVTSRHSLAQNEMSVASNSFAQGSARPKYHMKEEEDEYADQNIMRAPRNECIPWNWSRIHHRGKTFLDMAGRSFSCGLSDSKLKRGGPLPRGRDISDMSMMSDQSSSSTKSDAEAQPLLVEASGSHGSTENAGWVHDYSGELGIFADNLLKHEIDSDLASEARSGDRPKFRGRRDGSHQNLTQKYMPRTFRDLVGQNLVTQALSNAVVKRKVGLLYVFYGPHGTGKTSCARIFARALNCQSPDHPKPCGFCNSCVAHDMGKSRNIREVGPVSNFDFESIMDLIDNMIVSRLPSQYRVFIFDDCDTLSPDCWSALSKVFDRAPRRVVFVLVSSNLDVLPHVIISRCQKFFFPKLKDADIIYTLQWIATKEDLEIEKDALKLIASRSDGSLRDAEMTLEQLSLLGQRISVPLVQELVGLISDEKLVDLLDLALSADTVNTVKNLREIMESGVEPLALMSQLATVITDILAGSYDLTKERPRRKFFRQQGLSKEDMEKLRQALKTLSEAEKQLRMSNDRLTWLTAALLQLAPDQQYMLPSSSADSGFINSPLVVLSNTGGRERPRKSNVERAAMPNTDKGLSTGLRIGNLQAGSSSDIYCSGKIKVSSTDRKRNTGVGMLPEQIFTVSSDMNRVNGRSLSGKVHLEIEEIWLEVLGKIQVNGLKEFMYQEGKLVSVSFGAAPTVQLMFSSHLTKSKAEKFRAHILQAFESVLGSPVTIEIRCESRRDERAGINMPLILPTSQDCSSQIYIKPGLMNTKRMPEAGYDDIRKGVPKDRDGLNQVHLLQSDSIGKAKNEIVEIVASPIGPKANGHVDNNTQYDRRDHESGSVGDATCSPKKSALVSLPERRKLGDRNQSQSLVRSKVSLAHVIQQAEGCTQLNGWSKRKAVSIAEKLEQENLVTGDWSPDREACFAGRLLE